MTMQSLSSTSQTGRMLGLFAKIGVIMSLREMQCLHGTTHGFHGAEPTVFMVWNSWNIQVLIWEM